MTLTRKMEELQKKNIVDYETRGKNKVFFLKNSLEAKEFLFMAEHSKVIELIQLQPRLRKIVDKIKIEKSISLAILFGSYAKGTQAKSSDIDIYIETKQRKLKETFESMDSRLSVKIGEFNKDSPLAKEIIKNHIILKGVERYYELIH